MHLNPLYSASLNHPSHSGPILWLQRNLHFYRVQTLKYDRSRPVLRSFLEDLPRADPGPTDKNGHEHQ